MSFLGLLKQVGCRSASKLELIVLKVDVSAVDGTNAGLSLGENEAIIDKTATGKYTITLNRVASKPVAVVGGSCLGEGFLTEDTAATTSVVKVTLEDDAGTDADFDFSITLAAFY
jgi:hypothetical protein